jgi:hypothetical protein
MEAKSDIAFQIGVIPTYALLGANGKMIIN